MIGVRLYQSDQSNNGQWVRELLYSMCFHLWNYKTNDNIRSWYKGGVGVVDGPDHRSFMIFYLFIFQTSYLTSVLSWMILWHGELLRRNQGTQGGDGKEDPPNPHQQASTTDWATGKNPRLDVLGSGQGPLFWTSVYPGVRQRKPRPKTWSLVDPERGSPDPWRPGCLGDWEIVKGREPTYTLQGSKHVPPSTSTFYDTNKTWGPCPLLIPSLDDDFNSRKEHPTRCSDGRPDERPFPVPKDT